MDKKSDKVKWLSDLYCFDNNNKLRIFRAGWSDGYYHSATGLVQKANGDPGEITPKKRKVPANNRSDTPLKAAKTLAQQQWEKKQRVGNYKEYTKPPRPGDAAKYMDDRRWPAACKSWDKCKPDQLKCNRKNPWLGQPKIDGRRIMAWLKDGKAKLLSRKCLEKKFMTNIRTAATNILTYIAEKWPELDSLGLDGEVYAPHQESQSIISRSVNASADEDKLVFVIFDLMEYTLTFEDRQEILRKVALKFAKETCVNFLLATTLTDEDEIMDFKLECATNGYEEGIVLRRPDLLYTRKKEHKHPQMIKLKSIEDAEYKVIGWKEGNTDREGCVVWNLRDPEDKNITFWCQQEGDLAYQRELFKNAADYKGKLLTVKFMNKTAFGVPFHPRACRFRDEDDIASAEEESGHDSGSASSSE
jgi:hypothetical protein